MSWARDKKEVTVPDGVRLPGVTYHPRSPNASLEQLDRLAGVIKLTTPPSLDQLHGWMEDRDDEDECATRAGA